MLSYEYYLTQNCRSNKQVYFFLTYYFFDTLEVINLIVSISLVKKNPNHENIKKKLKNSTLTLFQLCKYF